MARFGEAVRDDLKPAAESLLRDVTKTQGFLYEEVSKVLQELMSYAVHLALPKELSDNISLIIGTAKRDFIRRTLKLTRDLELLHMKAIEGAEGGYIQDEWKKTFHEVHQAQGVGKFNAQKNKVNTKLIEGIDIYRHIGNRYKKDKCNLIDRGFEDHLKEFGHIINQIQADLDRCTVKEDVEIELELDEYRLRIAMKLEPIKKQIELLSEKLPEEKGEVVKGKGPVKRKAAAKSDGTGAKKQKKQIGAGSIRSLLEISKRPMDKQREFWHEHRGENIY
ncbi:hypothetical protein E2P81_ATG01444 [Venturia nashicola]|nr:hypothetical protein E2P81_ATG01444 [Venturia nashicola]